MSIYHLKNRYAVPGACYALNLNGFQMEPHVHARCEIMYLVAGSCTITVGMEKFCLKDRQFVFLDQNVVHNLYVAPNLPCTLLNFEFECHPQAEGIDLQELAEKSRTFRQFLENKQEYLLFNDSENVGYSLKDLIFELEKRKKDNEYLLQILFIRMLLEFTKCSEGDSSFTGILYLNKAKKFIQENLYDELHVSMVAEKVGINSAYLQTLFSKALNCGIMTYVNNLRMDNAAFLLKNSSLSITDIAFHVGFNSRQHFGYTFEKRFRMSPKQYRKLNGQNLIADTNGMRILLGEDGKYKAVTFGRGR